MTRYERVTWQEGRRKRSVILQDPAERGPAGLAMLTGTQVDREGHEIEPSQAFLRAAGAETGAKLYVIERGLVTSREPLEMDLHYGYLVPEGTARIGVSK